MGFWCLVFLFLVVVVVFCYPVICCFFPVPCFGILVADGLN